MFSAIIGYLILEPERLLEAVSGLSYWFIDRQQPTYCSRSSF
jgi:hypothetical protein